jgi:cell volume regulation protein A
VPPRGSTRLREGDIVHVLVRTRAADEVRRLTDRWRSGPIGPPVRPAKPMHGRGAVFSAWPWGDQDGDPAQPGAIRDTPIIAQLRMRRDEPGGLWVLADGRYAVSGPVGAVGGRRELNEWAVRRMRKVSVDERAWLQTVVGALAADRHETRSDAQADGP